MTTWSVIQGDILDQNADGLICSANPSLNLSGGVGGSFSMRYGNEMQEFLRRYLQEHNQQFVEPGVSVLTPSCGSPFKAVTHAVAIDAFYDTDAHKILSAYRSAIDSLVGAGCETIVAACLACGYGRCSPADFVEAVKPLTDEGYVSIARFTFVTTNQELAEELQDHFL